MTIGEEELHDAIEDLAARPGPPTSIDAPGAIVRGRRIVRRRRFALSASVVAAGGTAMVLAFTVLPTHGTKAHSGTVQLPGASKLPKPSRPGSDPLTLSGTFGWLPANASNAGYSLHSSQIQAVARGSSSVGGNTPMIWLTIYPKGTTPALGKFADGTSQLRLDAPDVNGHTAYWMTASASDPTNADDTYLRWQSADGQWGELHGYYLATSSITTEMLRVAAGVDFAPHSVPLPLWISGLPSSAVAVEADLNRPSLSGAGPWDLDLILTVGAATFNVSVVPAASWVDTTPPQQDCKTASGLKACVSLYGSVDLPSSLSGGAAQILKNINLLGLDPANWTTAVLQR